MAIDWIASVEHNRWLGTEARALLELGKKMRVPTGFSRLLPNNKIDPDQGVELWITGRMVFSFSIGCLLGIPGMRNQA